MRTLRSILLLFVVVIGITMGFCVMFAAWQIDQLQAVAQPTPQPLSAAELIATGPGDNFHLELIHFTYGKPLIEEADGEWVCVWLPLYPTEGLIRSEDRPIFLRTTKIHNQTELDALLRTPKVNVLTSTPLTNGSAWKIGSSHALLEAYPRLDPAKVEFLTDPHLAIVGWVVLGEQTLFNRSTTWMVWLLSGLFLAVGGCCLLWLLYGGEKKPPAGRVGNPVLTIPARPRRR